jgi:hypothetical protein
MVPGDADMLGTRARGWFLLLLDLSPCARCFRRLGGFSSDLDEHISAPPLMTLSQGSRVEC